MYAFKAYAGSSIMLSVTNLKGKYTYATGVFGIT